MNFLNTKIAMPYLRIKIIGTDDSMQKALLKNVEQAAYDLNIKPRIVTITDWEDIVKYDIIQTPALVIRNQVVSQGFVPLAYDIVRILKAFLPDEITAIKDNAFG